MALQRTAVLTRVDIGHIGIGSAESGLIRSGLPEYGKGDAMEQLGTPFAWGIFAVIALAVAAAMIIYGVYAIRKKDETSPALGEVCGTLKQDWTRTGKIDFHVAALESTSPQQLILRVQEKKIIENSMGEDVMQLRWRLATVEEAKEVVVCWNTHGSQNRPN